MASFSIIVAGLLVLACASGVPLPNQKSSLAALPFKYYTKADWGGQPAIGTSRLTLPVPFVVIHHSYVPGACFTAQDCKSAMRGMQNYHQGDQGWTDIGYNFAVGSDGAVYEGRGWHAVGAHAVGYNVRSIGIVLIGDWVSDLPPPMQLQATKDLIAIGVTLGFITPDYHLIGHRQASATECPGESLYREITSWDRFYPQVPNKTKQNLLD